MAWHNTLMFVVYKYGRWLLVAAIVAVNAYIMVTPWMPAVAYKVSPPAKNFKLPENVPAAPEKNAAATPPPPPESPHTASKNTLYIPSIGLTEEIYEGSAAATLNKGVWHRPFTSRPDLGGNTVVAGHRFSYKWRWVFYHLDKIKPGDTMYVDWARQRYTYKVTEVNVVKPSDISIEQPSKEDTLTVYTCTPMWSSANRLVVVARRI